MNIGDFISKTASEALAKIIADAPKQFMALLTSGVRKTVKVDQTLRSCLLHHLDQVATLIWASEDSFEASGADNARASGREAIGVHTVRLTRLYLVRRQPVIIHCLATDLEITSYRGFNFEALLKSAVAGNHFGRHASIYSVSVGKDSVSLQGRIANRERIPWVSPALAALESEIKAWRSARDFCLSKGLNWRRGWLLYGPPGNGKSFGIATLAAKHYLDLISLNLNMSDDSFQLAWKQIQAKAPCIVLIEDIDDIIRGRQNVKDPEKGVSFSTLLNCIDGVNSTNGVIVAITTNDLSAIDPALGRPRDESHWNQLSTRPGRLDRCIRFDNPDLQGRIDLGKLLLSEAEASTLAHKYEDVSLVQFQALCREIAFAQLQDLDSLTSYKPESKSGPRVPQPLLGRA